MADKKHKSACGTSASPASSIPRGIEVLVKKAAVDPSFKDILLEKRAGAAESIGLRLDPTEVAMLSAIPEAQFSAIIAGTKVAPGIRTAFMGYAAAVMLAALSVQAYSVEITEAQTDKDSSDATGALITEVSSNGTLSGRISDLQGNGIPCSEILLNGTRLGALTDKFGNYLIGNIPEGQYTVTIARAGYEDQIIQHVIVRAGAITELSVCLSVNQKQLYGGCRPN